MFPNDDLIKKACKIKLNTIIVGAEEQAMLINLIKHLPSPPPQNKQSPERKDNARN